MNKPEIRMIDQDGQLVPVQVTQDGDTPRPVTPGRRTRFNVRADWGKVNAYLVDRIQIADADIDKWRVCDARVNRQSLIDTSRRVDTFGDAPEENGFPGCMFSEAHVGSPIFFITCQMRMNLTLDVVYTGPGVVEFGCLIKAKVAYR